MSANIKVFASESQGFRELESRSSGLEANFRIWELATEVLQRPHKRRVLRNPVAPNINQVMRVSRDRDRWSQRVLTDRVDPTTRVLGELVCPCRALARPRFCPSIQRLSRGSCARRRCNARMTRYGPTFAARWISLQTLRRWTRKARGPRTAACARSQVRFSSAPGSATSGKSHDLCTRPGAAVMSGIAHFGRPQLPRRLACPVGP